jgi:uncharacterized protein YegP (UPF0339 family)
VNFMSIGEHRLDFRYANGSSSARAMAVSIDGVVVRPSLSFAPTGSWSTWKDASILTTLQAGTHRVRLTATGQSGPNVDSLTVVEPASAVSLEAEDAAFSGAVVSRSHPGYLGSGYLDFFTTKNAFVEWTVDAPQAGYFAFDFRYANGGTSSRTQELVVNGTFAGYATFPPTGSWTAWRTQRMTWNLARGRNTVRLRAGLDGPNIDSLSISELHSQQVLEAEAGQMAGAVVAASHPGYTGSGYVDFFARSGGYVEWVFDAAELREYSLAFRYANGGTADRPLAIEVDGVRLSDPLSFKPTGSWTNWDNSFLIYRADAGRHRVRLWTIGSDGANIDSLTVR